MGIPESWRVRLETGFETEDWAIVEQNLRKDQSNSKKTSSPNLFPS
jgi:hypothetical protein